MKKGTLLRELKNIRVRTLMIFVVVALVLYIFSTKGCSNRFGSSISRNRDRDRISPAIEYDPSKGKRVFDTLLNYFDHLGNGPSSAYSRASAEMRRVNDEQHRLIDEETQLVNEGITRIPEQYITPGTIINPVRRPYENITKVTGRPITSDELKNLSHDLLNDNNNTSNDIVSGRRVPVQRRVRNIFS